MRPVIAIPILCLLVATAACARLPSGDPVRVRFDTAPVPTDVDPWVNWHHRPVTTFEEMEDLDGAQIDVVEMKGAGAGTTGARQVVLRLPERDDQYRVKAKEVPGDLDGWNNSPRTEIASYRIQILFLDPTDYVVPTSDLYCIPMAKWEKHAEKRLPTIPGTDCVLLNLSFWLEDVTVPDRVYDPERFLNDANYAFHLANLNILTYLADHHDQRRGNILASVHEKDRHVFAIDNGITFGSPIYNWFVPSSFQWSRILVPALPEQSVDLLRALERSDLDFLGTVTQMEADASGRLRLVRPEPAWDPKRGARRRGTSVQFGLTTDEIDDVWERIEELLEAVDEGRLTLF